MTTFNTTYEPMTEDDIAGLKILLQEKADKDFKGNVEAALFSYITSFMDSAATAFVDSLSGDSELHSMAEEAWSNVEQSFEQISPYDIY